MCRGLRHTKPTFSFVKSLSHCPPPSRYASQPVFLKRALSISMSSFLRDMHQKSNPDYSIPATTVYHSFLSASSLTPFISYFLYNSVQEQDKSTPFFVNFAHLSHSHTHQSFQSIAFSSTWNSTRLLQLSSTHTVLTI